MSTLSTFMNAFYKDEQGMQRSFVKEDQHLENGQYFCTCTDCNNVFIGYKLRRLCKLCSEKLKQEANNE